jgi:hypothetical protein
MLLWVPSLHSTSQSTVITVKRVTVPQNRLHCHFAALCGSTTHDQTRRSKLPRLNMNHNSTVPSTSRAPLFTPKRHLSTHSTPSTINDLNFARLSRTNSSSSTSSSLSTPQTLLSTTHKKYKAPLSVESRSKATYGKTAKPVLPPVPGTPSRKDGTQSRPRTPVTPRKGAESPSLMHGSPLHLTTLSNWILYTPEIRQPLLPAKPIL